MTASPTLRTEAGAVMMARRRSRIWGSRASARARPMCDWAARAASRATSGVATPSRTSRSATALAVGIRRPRWRQRERIVAIMSSGLGAHSSHTVCSGGSSMALSRAFAPDSPRRSASSTTMTRHSPWEGEDCACRTRERAVSTLMIEVSVAAKTTSAFVRPIVVRHPAHWPHPTVSPVHCRAAAKARAATERPEPGGPVMSQAWLMERASSEAREPPREATIARADAAASLSLATAASCPTSEDQTLIIHPRARPGTRPGLPPWWRACGRCPCSRSSRAASRGLQGSRGPQTTRPGPPQPARALHRRPRRW